MTTISTKVGMTLLTIYWLVMGGMSINLYYQNTHMEQSYERKSN